MNLSSKSAQFGLLVAFVLLATVQSQTRQGCRVNQSIKNGRLGVGTSEFGDYRAIICDEGYAASSAPAVAQCKDDGEWEILATCRRILGRPSRVPQQENVCDPNVNILNGQLAGGDNVLGSNQAILCDEGYYPSPEDAYARCENNGWYLSGRCRPVPVVIIQEPQIEATTSPLLDSESQEVIVLMLAILGALLLVTLIVFVMLYLLPLCGVRVVCL